MKEEVGASSFDNSKLPFGIYYDSSKLPKKQYYF